MLTQKELFQAEKDNLYQEQESFEDSGFYTASESFDYDATELKHCYKSDSLAQAVDKIEELGVCPEVDDLESVEEQFEAMEAYLESMFNSGIPMNSPQTQALMIIRKVKMEEKYSSVKNYDDFIKSHTASFASSIAEMHSSSIKMYNDDIKHLRELSFNTDESILGRVVSRAIEERGKHIIALDQLTAAVHKKEGL